MNPQQLAVKLAQMVISTRDAFKQFKNKVRPTIGDDDLPPIPPCPADGAPLDLEEEIRWFDALSLRMEDRKLPKHKRLRLDKEDKALMTAAKKLISKAAEMKRLEAEAESARLNEDYASAMGDPDDDEEPSKKKSQWQARRIVATFFEDEETRKHWKPETRNFDPKLVRFIVAQKEKSPKTDRIHWQIYAQFNCRVRSRKKAQKLLFVGKSFCANARGTPEDNIEYCTKDEEICLAHDKKHGTNWASKGWRIDNTEVFRWGTPSLARINGEGSCRWDLKSIQDEIDSGATIQDIRRDHFELYVRYRRGIEAYYNAQINDKSTARRDVSCTCFWGPSGCGKTNSAATYLIDKYGENGYYEPVINKSGQMWFNLYQGQKAIVINEFYGQTPFHFLQKLTDSYRFECEKKGDTIFAQWNEVVFTSNVHPKHWYNGYRKVPAAVAKSFCRRFKSVIYTERESGPAPSQEKSLEDLWNQPQFTQTQTTTKLGKRKLCSWLENPEKDARLKKRARLANEEEAARLKRNAHEF